MNREIANILKAFIEPLGFADTLAGLVKTIETTDEKGKAIKFPASVDANTTPKSRDWQYADLVPNSKKKSIIYFEDSGLETTGKTKSGIAFEGNLRLVCWINKTMVSEQFPLFEILKALPDQPFNASPITGIKVSAGKILGAEDRIFSRYTYEESLTQYMMFPFTAFAVDLKIKFNVADCI